jgi:hypothetical protein
MNDKHSFVEATIKKDNKSAWLALGNMITEEIEESSKWIGKKVNIKNTDILEEKIEQSF